MEKQYGLILPGRQQKTPTVRELKRPAIFDESSESSDDNSRANVPSGPLKSRIGTSTMGSGATSQRLAERLQKKALEEDPTVYQYDELYEDMASKRETEKQIKAKEPKKPKYINKLLETAERRKLEYELRVERQVQKEREAEGEQFKDKESFVTSTYRKKLEEMRILQEKEKRDEYLETIGDVRKQHDLDGFYRHLYEQKMGTTKEVDKPTFMSTTSPNPDENEVSYKPIKSGRSQHLQHHHRAYRKRQSSNDDDDDDKPGCSVNVTEAKNVHLANNIDADSDFSIDSSSSDSSDNEEDKANESDNNKKSTEGKKMAPPSTNLNIDPSRIALKLDIMKTTKGQEYSDFVKINDDDEDGKTIETNKSRDTLPKPKEKIDIWKKRTVGEIFDAAVQRYYERQAARNT